MGRKGWYEREEVNRISLDWVKANCKNITKREKELLRIVHERGLVRRDHLEKIHPDYQNINRRTNVINRSIKKLFQKMCIDKVHEESEFMKGSKPAFISLDRAGAILLDVPFKRKIKQEKRMIGHKKYVFRELPSNHRHIHGVNDLEVQTLDFCKNNDFALKIWHLEQKNAKKVSFNGDFVLIPDVFCIINAKNKPIILFIEYDTGSENRGYKNHFPTIRDKLEKYQKYMISGIWKNEWWFKKIKTPFPTILFVTEDRKRVNYTNKKGKELGLSVSCIHSEEYLNFLRSYT